MMYLVWCLTNKSWEAVITYVHINHFGGAVQFCELYVSTKGQKAVKTVNPDRFLNGEDLDEDKLIWRFLSLTLGTVADLAVIPIQDYLCLGSEAGINRPSTIGGNWTWRLQKGQIQTSLLERMKKAALTYGRIRG